MNARVNVTPELIQSLVDKFAEFRVTKEMLEKRIQRRLESIPPAMVIQLGKIYNSLKDGMSKPDEWFGESKPEVEKAVIDINDLAPSAEPNRGHGNEGLDNVKPMPAPEPKAKAKPAAPKAAPKPLENPNYAEGSDPDPFTGTDLFDKGGK